MGVISFVQRKLRIMIDVLPASGILPASAKHTRINSTPRFEGVLVPGSHIDTGVHISGRLRNSNQLVNLKGLGRLSLRQIDKNPCVIRRNRLITPYLRLRNPVWTTIEDVIRTALRVVVVIVLAHFWIGAFN